MSDAPYIYEEAIAEAKAVSNQATQYHRWWEDERRRREELEQRITRAAIKVKKLTDHFQVTLNGVYAGLDAAQRKDKPGIFILRTLEDTRRLTNDLAEDL